MHKVLITGGAGFIGSHLADELLAHGYEVRVLDVLDPQVHGESRRRPEYLARHVELIIGDVNDPAKVEQALQGVDAVYHFASAVGVGSRMNLAQSTFRIDQVFAWTFFLVILNLLLQTAVAAVEKLALRWRPEATVR